MENGLTVDSQRCSTCHPRGFIGSDWILFLQVALLLHLKAFSKYVIQKKLIRVAKREKKKHIFVFCSLTPGQSFSHNFTAQPPGGRGQKATSRGHTAPARWWCVQVNDYSASQQPVPEPRSPSNKCPRVYFTAQFYIHLFCDHATHRLSPSTPPRDLYQWAPPTRHWAFDKRLVFPWRRSRTRSTVLQFTSPFVTALTGPGLNSQRRL